MEIAGFLLVTLGVPAGFLLTRWVHEERVIVERILGRFFRLPVIMSFFTGFFAGWIGSEISASVLFVILFLVGSAGRSVVPAWIASLVGVLAGLFWV